MELNTVVCADALDLVASLPDDSVDFIITDPPYARANLPLYEKLAAAAARILKPGKFCLVMSGGLYQDTILSSMSKHLTYYWTFHIYMPGSTTGEVHPGGNHKPIITRVKPVNAFVKGWGEPRTVMYDPISDGGKDKRFHLWGQDEKTFRYFIECFTSEGDLVLDPLCGGGTIPAVCVALNRHWIACDKDAQAVEVTRARVRNPLFIPENQQLRLEFAK
jgi:hypothetical protein